MVPPRRCTIGEAVDGELVELVGRVRPGPGPLLESPLGQLRCVYFAVYENFAALELGEAPGQRDERDFLLEDDTGRAFIKMYDVAVDLGVRGYRQAISAIDADIQQVSQRLRVLKDERRTAAPARQSEIGRTLAVERGLATLLCATRAHARGRVHLGGSLAEQAHYIRERSAHYRQQTVAEQLPRYLGETYEATIEVNKEIIVRGYSRLEPDPDPQAALGTYRARALRPVLHAPPGGRLEIETRDEERRAEALARRRRYAAIGKPGPSRPAARRGASRWLLWVAVAAAAAASLWLF